MNSVRRFTAAAAIALAFGGASLPAASGASAATTSLSVTNQVARTWHATVQCQIVRISDNNVVGYERADGTGNTQQAAINDAARNIPVPEGHYKRHCDAKRIW